MKSTIWRSNTTRVAQDYTWSCTPHDPNAKFCLSQFKQPLPSGMLESSAGWGSAEEKKKWMLKYFCLPGVQEWHSRRQDTTAQQRCFFGKNIGKTIAKTMDETNSLLWESKPILWSAGVQLHILLAVCGSTHSSPVLPLQVQLHPVSNHAPAPESAWCCTERGEIWWCLDKCPVLGVSEVSSKFTLFPLDGVNCYSCWGDRFTLVFGSKHTAPELFFTANQGASSLQFCSQFSCPAQTDAHKYIHITLTHCASLPHSYACSAIACPRSCFAMRKSSFLLFIFFSSRRYCSTA